MKQTIILILFALLLTPSATAASLPRDVEAALPDGLASAVEDGSVAGGLDWLREKAGGLAGEALRAGTRNAALLVLAALGCGAMEGLADGAGGAAPRYVPYCGVLAVTSLAAGDLHALIGLGARTVDELDTISKLLLPSMAASMAAGGLVSSASVWQVTTLMVCGLLNDAVSRLLPLVYCHAAASAAGAALDDGRLEKLADGLRKLVSGALVAAMTVFSGYLGLAGVLTGAADRATVKAAKLAVSGAIPVVGGVLSDAAESAFAAAGALRGTIGALGVFAILAVCLAPLLRLGAQYLLYRLAAFAAGLVGTKTLGDLIDRLGETFALVFAMTAACALTLLVALLVAASMATG